MNNPRAWHLLSIADEIPPHVLDQALNTLARDDIERGMLRKRDHSPPAIKPIWRAALATRLRRRLLIPLVS